MKNYNIKITNRTPMEDKRENSLSTEELHKIVNESDEWNRIFNHFKSLNKKIESPVDVLPTDLKDSWMMDAFLEPLDFLCNKYKININSNYKELDTHIKLSYRTSLVKRSDEDFYGIFIDDKPSIIYDKYEIEKLKEFDFFVVTNRKIGEYIIENICDKPIIFTEGWGSKDYYIDTGVLKERKFSKTKRSVVMIGAAYWDRIDLNKFSFEGWELLYFGYKDKKIPNTVFRPFTDVKSFHKEVSEFSPDVIIQPWLNDLNDGAYYYKGKLKMEESVVLNSCLLAEGYSSEIYEINNGINGYKWDDINHLEKIMRDTSIEDFRRVGMSHINDDEGVLKKLNNDIVKIYEEHLKGR